MLRPAKHLADTRNTWTAGRQQDDCDGRMTAITKRVCCTMFAASRVTQESHRRWTRNQLKKPTRSLTFEWLVLNSIKLSTEYTRKLLRIVSHDHHRLVNDVCQTLSLKVYSLESKLSMHSHSQVQIHQLTSTDSLWHNRRKKRLTLLLPSLQNLFLSKKTFLTTASLQTSHYFLSSLDYLASPVRTCATRRIRPSSSDSKRSHCCNSSQESWRNLPEQAFVHLRLFTPELSNLNASKEPNHRKIATKSSTDLERVFNGSRAGFQWISILHWRISNESHNRNHRNFAPKNVWARCTSNSTIELLFSNFVNKLLPRFNPTTRRVSKHRSSIYLASVLHCHPQRLSSKCF